MSTYSSCNDPGGFADELVALAVDSQSAEQIGKAWLDNSSLEKWFPITAEELNKLREENKKLIEQMSLLVMFLYSESADYEAESLGERIFLDFAEPAYELIKDKWKCERCGNSFQIDGTCEECLANKRDDI